MDIFDFEELVADMLHITDDQREDDDYLSGEFEAKYGIEFELTFQFVLSLLMRTPIVQAGLTGNKYHAFVTEDQTTMLMKALEQPLEECSADE